MQVHTYRARPAGLGGPAYCDTSFLIDLFANAHPTAIVGASGSARARVAEAHAFYIWARLQGLEFYTSFLAIEEAYQKLLFASLNAHARQLSPPQTWKQLRTSDHATFQRLLSDGRTAVGTFHHFMRGSGVQLITFGVGRFAGLLMREGRLCRYARAVLAQYESEAMDAFHYALMRRCSIDLAVASDRDWSAFPYGTLVTAA